MVVPYNHVPLVLLSPLFDEDTKFPRTALADGCACGLYVEEEVNSRPSASQLEARALHSLHHLCSPLPTSTLCAMRRSVNGKVMRNLRLG
jgi:hypothetical protein